MKTAWRTGSPERWIPHNGRASAEGGTEQSAPYTGGNLPADSEEHTPAAQRVDPLQWRPFVWQARDSGALSNHAGNVEPHLARRDTGGRRFPNACSRSGSGR